MKKLVICVLVVLTCATQMGHAAERRGDERGWIGKRCDLYRGDYCRVPFVVALAHAEELYRNIKRVQLRGFLVREDGYYTLYADRESAMLGWQSDAIKLSGASVSKFKDSLSRWASSNVVLRGKVVLDATDHDEYWVSFDLDSPVLLAGIRGEKL